MFTTTHLYATDPLAGHPSTAVRHDNVRAVSVVLFVDQLLVTLRHYASTGRIHAKGLTSQNAKDYNFPSTPAGGYPRHLVENLQTYAYFALQAFETGHINDAVDQFEDVALTLTELAMAGEHVPPIQGLKGL